MTLRYGEHNGKGGLEAASSQYASNTASAISTLRHLALTHSDRSATDAWALPAAESYHVLHVYQSPDCERPLLPSEPLERPLRPAWFATFAHVLPFASPNPGRAGSEVSTSLVALPIRGGRVCLWNPDTVAKTRPVPAVAWRTGSEIETKEKEKAAEAAAAAAAEAALAAAPPKPAARAVVASGPPEVIDVDMSSDEGEHEAPDIKPHLLRPVVPPCAYPSLVRGPSCYR